MTETDVTIANGAGLILSLVCSYVPGAKQKYAALDGTGKRLVMLGLLFLAALCIFGASCAGTISTVVCDNAGATHFLCRQGFLSGRATGQNGDLCR